MIHRKRGIAAICAFFLGLPVMCGVSQEKALRITPEQFDFGAIDEGTPAVTTATLLNTGSIPVEVTNVRTN